MSFTGKGKMSSMPIITNHEVHREVLVGIHAFPSFKLCYFHAWYLFNKGIGEIPEIAWCSNVLVNMSLCMPCGHVCNGAVVVFILTISLITILITQSCDCHVICAFLQRACLTCTSYFLKVCYKYYTKFRTLYWMMLISHIVWSLHSCKISIIYGKN